MFVYALNPKAMQRETDKTIDTKEGLLYFFMALPKKYIPNKTPIPVQIHIHNAKVTSSFPKIKKRQHEAAEVKRIMYILVEAATGGETPIPI